MRRPSKADKKAITNIVNDLLDGHNVGYIGKIAMQHLTALVAFNAAQDRLHHTEDMLAKHQLLTEE